MTREDIEKAVILSIDSWCNLQGVDQKELNAEVNDEFIKWQTDFAIKQVNATLDEAESLFAGTTIAEALIRSLKISE